MNMTGYSNYKCKFCPATLTAQEINSLASTPLKVVHLPNKKENISYTKVYPNILKGSKFQDLLYIHCPNCEKDSKWEIEKN